MKKIDIKGFPKIFAYEKDDIQTAIIGSVLGVSDWCMENVAQSVMVDAQDFPAEELRDIKFENGQYVGTKTKRKFPKYVQFTFLGKEIPEAEDKALQANETFIDVFYESSNNVVSYRFQCPDSLNIETDEEK